MDTKDLQKEIEKAWEDRDNISQETKGIRREVVEETLSLLDQGKIRVANKVDGKWIVNVQENYFVRLIWISAIIMSLGAVLVIRRKIYV